MMRRFLIAIFLAGSLLLLSLTPTAFAEEGSEIATRGPTEGYAGAYHVRYFYESGEFSDEYDLIIEKFRDF